MKRCPRCGEENPARARFCLACGSAIASEEPAPQERKVVTVMFCDLVGFTAAAERLDPEDVQALLTAYQRTAREQIERFGGSVERFVGDGVLALFGVPKAHEDDPERAVRAALSMIEELSSLDIELAVRIGINTGEVLVNLGVDSRRGDVVTGDVVNSASRLEEAAPANVVLVGETTYWATHRFIDYEALPPISVKGKAEPIRVWRARRSISRFGVDTHFQHATPLTGREHELELLKGVFRRALKESSVQLVTITGEPGVGKSRLVAELFDYVDNQLDPPELISWRQGRCLSYGEGITFWALGEIVKAQAGINGSDSPEEAANKIAAAVGAVAVDEADRAWVQSRLSPLVGAIATAAGGAEKEEIFTAWLRFLEAVAIKNPLVLVFEDLHWADAGLLEFIEHLVEWSAGVAILIVCTARPELFEKHRAWAGGSRNATTISLSSLTDSETAQLISALLAQAMLPADIHATLLDRAGGNPLYAEEFIRMLSDRDILQQKDRILTLASEVDIPMPENIHALIAARLDTLTPERKSLLHDAAVVGKVFWSGAIAAVGDLDEAMVRQPLHELVRKELVRPTRLSSIESQQEYGFWHALVRDVSYGQIPRSSRGHKHRAVAGWLEAIAGERVSDHAEVLAHHYSEALALARASGGKEADQLIAPTRRFLAMAGDRASGLDAARARRYYQEALMLCDADHTAKADTLLKVGDLSERMGLSSEAEDYLRQALAIQRRDQDSSGEARSLRKLGAICVNQGRIDEGLGLISQACVIAERDGPGPELARVYAGHAEALLMSAGPLDESLTWAERALSVAQIAGDEEMQTQVLFIRGMARCEAGDIEGLADIRLGAVRIKEIFEAAAPGHQLMTSDASGSYANLGDYAWLIEGPASGLEAKRHAVQLSARRGLVGDAMWAKSESLRMLFDMGEWDELETVAQETLAWSGSHGARGVEIRALSYFASVLLHRGRGGEAVAVERRIDQILVDGVDSEGMVPALEVAANVRSTVGDYPAAIQCLSRLAELTEQRPSWSAWFLPSVVRVLIGAGELAMAEDRMVDESNVGATRDKNSVLTAKAILLEAKGEFQEARNLYQEAAQRWADYGFVLEEGRAHLGLARSLIALGDHEASIEPLNKARVIFSRLGAVPLTNEADTYLRKP